MTRKNQSVPATQPLELDESQLRLKEQLRLKYVLVDDLVLLERNPKRHSIDLIAASIVENGFRDAIAWDAKLNGGRGGIVEGNGRAEALKFIQDQGREVPRGIATNEEGQWAVPVLFGIDARSEAAALRYSLDHNNLTMAGGEGFTALDMSRMFDSDLYTEMLQELASLNQLPLTVDGDDLEILLKFGDGFAGIPEDNKDIDEEAMADTKHECPSCGFQW